MNRVIKRQLPLWSVAALLIAAALPIHADVYRASDSSGNLVRLFEDPCPMTTGWLVMKRASMRYQGKEFAACWAVLKGVILIFDDAGDISPMPVSAFRKEESV